MKVVTGVKSLLAAAVAAAGLVAFAEPVVEITKAWQANPGSGVVDFTYEVKDVGTAPCDLIFRVEAKGCETTCTFTNSNVAAGVVTTNINYKAVLGKVSPNVSIYASLEEHQQVGLQLWEGGPIFATCNVGASKPEEYGYYFWWGDTVGYVRNGSSWDAVDGSKTGFSFSSANCPTYGKTIEQLYNNGNGFIDANSADGKLKPEYDAARVHRGAPWRMMTDAELQKLVNPDYCTATWMAVNGVWGCKFTGKGVYAANSIFLPAGGNGYEALYGDEGVLGLYWSSAPNSNTSNHAYNLYFLSGESGRGYNDRYMGFTVRPVRD